MSEANDVLSSHSWAPNQDVCLRCGRTGLDILNSQEGCAPKPWGRPFVKGQSGNPSGRPSMKRLRNQLRRRNLGPLALDALKADLQGDPGAERSRAEALVLAYLYGKPSEQVQLTGADGEQLHVVIEINRVVKEG